MHIFFNKKEKKMGFSALSSGEKKRIIVKAARDANKDQLELVREFDRKFGNLKQLDRQYR
ncbi:MAG: hypothetical protein WC564_00290 [Patescibacteria group bacterium]|jgi:hypothetical protein